MKKLVLILSVLTMSQMAMALNVTCKTPVGNKIETIQIKKYGTFNYEVDFNGKKVAGFQCIDKSESEFFQGIVQCITDDDDNTYAVHVTQMNGSYPNGALFIKGGKQINLACVENN